MARRGLQALHEICAGDPEGVARHLLDAHLRNSTEAVTVDDVSEQMSLLGISDKSLAWIGARAALWRRADCKLLPHGVEGHLYYLRDDGVSQWEHPLQNELRSSTTPLVIPRWPRPPPAASTRTVRELAAVQRFEPDVAAVVEPDGRGAAARPARSGARGARSWTRTDAGGGPGRRAPSAAAARRRAARAARRARDGRASDASSASSSPRRHRSTRRGVLDAGPTSPLTAGSGNADLAANFANMQGKLEALQARMLSRLFEEDGDATSCLCRGELRRSETAGRARRRRGRAGPRRGATSRPSGPTRRPSSRERPASAPPPRIAPPRKSMRRGTRPSPQMRRRKLQEGRRQRWRPKRWTWRAAAAAHAAASFLSGSRFRALLKANEQLRGALATQARSAPRRRSALTSEARRRLGSRRARDGDEADHRGEESGRRGGARGDTTPPRRSAPNASPRTRARSLPGLARRRARGMGRGRG